MSGCFTPGAPCCVRFMYHAAYHDVVEAVDSVLERGVDRLAKALQDAQRPLADARGPVNAHTMGEQQ